MPNAVGFVNNGNTCYLNAVLQALLRVPTVINVTAFMGSHGSRLLQSLEEIVQIQFQNKTVKWNPSKFNKICAEINPMWKAGREQDASEFLEFVVEEIGLNSRFSFEQVWRANCHHCDVTKQRRSDMRTVLTLDHVHTPYGDEDLEQLLYLNSIRIQTECGHEPHVYRMWELDPLPAVLCIQLPRLILEHKEVVRDTGHIQFMETLNLPLDQHDDEGELHYRLHSVISHFGGVNSGHYKAYLYLDGFWEEWDDTVGRPVPYSLVNTTNAYLLLYQLSDKYANQRIFDTLDEPALKKGIDQAMLTDEGGEEEEAKAEAPTESEELLLMVNDLDVEMEVEGKDEETAVPLDSEDDLDMDGMDEETAVALEQTLDNLGMDGMDEEEKDEETAVALEQTLDNLDMDGMDEKEKDEETAVALEQTLDNLDMNGMDEEEKDEEISTATDDDDVTTGNLDGEKGGNRNEGEKDVGLPTLAEELKGLVSGLDIDGEEDEEQVVTTFTEPGQTGETNEQMVVVKNQKGHYEVVRFKYSSDGKIIRKEYFR